MKRRIGGPLVVVAVVSAIGGAGAGAARADTDCDFVTLGRTQFLKANCSTDSTLLVPEGFTLDGLGRTITARDPADGHFLGAVIQNAGSVAHVRNLTVDTQHLTNVCNPDGPSDQRLRGVLLVSASGSLINNTVRNVNKGESGCQEGSAIEVRNPPFDGSHPATQTVQITANRVSTYQKTGILVNGDVEADVRLNRVTGLGPVDYIAQNGIQFGFGARGTITLNHIEDNAYTPANWVSAGILVTSAGDDVAVRLNHVERCNVGIALASTKLAVVEANRIEGSTFAALVLEADASGNLITHNQATDNGDYGFFVDGDANLVRDNRIAGSAGVGLLVEGSENTLERNRVARSGELDIENQGDNRYSANHCQSSTGAPVDCP